MQTSKQKVGLIYQKDVIAEIMEKYIGNIYITKSLYLNFKNEIVNTYYLNYDEWDGNVFEAQTSVNS